MLQADTAQSLVWPKLPCQIRGAVGDELKLHCSVVDNVQVFTGRVKKVHQRHYAALQTEAFDDLGGTFQNNCLFEGPNW